ncbi:MAG: hypothetical protein Q4A54_06580 [Parabacteroides sp.]|nr:hypothetical protein [Parabacteroides sp.]
MMANILMSGESSVRAMTILVPTENYRQRLLGRLINDGMIRKFQKDDLTGYRLTKKGKKMLMSMNTERFAFYGADNADFTMRRTAFQYRRRQHRISEVLAIMDRIDTDIYRDKKPAYFQKNGMQTLEPVQSAFFHVKEVKEQADLTRKIVNSKMTGVWISKDISWLCYNAFNEKMQWYENVEQRAYILLNSMIRNSVHTRSLLFGQNMEMAKQYLEDAKQQAFISSFSFEKVCYVPLDENGVFLLKILGRKDLYQYLFSLLLEDTTEKKETEYFIHDGFNQENNPILICIDCDLKRLIQFRTQMLYAGRNYEIICFDFQKEVIKEYCGEETKISTVDSGKIKKSFFSD